jgi:hypothetical protein
VLADLAPGEYLAMCPLPTGRIDMSAPPPDGAPHSTHGMTHQFVVEQVRRSDRRRSARMFALGAAPCG